jgi:hypothetical protein
LRESEVNVGAWQRRLPENRDISMGRAVRDRRGGALPGLALFSVSSPNRAADGDLAVRAKETTPIDECGR